MKFISSKLSVIVLITLALLTEAGRVSAQSVGISSATITPDPQSILELRTTTKGVLLPRLTSAERATLTLAPLAITDEGLTIYNTTTDRYNYWDGTQWIEMASSGSVTGLTLDDAYDAGGSGTGRTITADAGSIDIIGAGGLLVSGGKVGIGTASPNSLLELNTAGGGSTGEFLLKTVRNSSVAGDRIGIGFGVQGSAHIVKSGIMHERAGGNGVGKLHFLVDDSNDANDVSFTEARMTIDQNGLVGIGTTAPAAKLHVAGTTRITDLAGSGTAIVMTDNNGDLYESTSLVGSGLGDNLGNHSATQLLDMNANAINEVVQINSSGDHIELMRNRVNDTSYEWTGFYSGSTRQGIILYDGAWSGANNLTDEFGITAESGNRLTLNTNGNHIALMPDGGGYVGLGTTSPTYPFHVTKTKSGDWQSRFTNGSSNVYLAHQGGYGMHINTGGTNSTTRYALEVRNASQTHLYVRDDGNVGIGTTSPAQKLDVAGNVTADRYYDRNNTAYYLDPASTTYLSEVGWGDSFTRTQTKSDAGAIGTAKSGFYQTSAPSPASSWYTGASNWQHLMETRHSNTGNNFSMQIAGSFFNQDFWVRKTNNNPSTAWARMVTSANMNSITGHIVNNGSGDWQIASNSSATSYSQSSLELRETNFGGAGQQPPRLGFHWGGVVASQISIESNGTIAIRNNPGTGYENFRCLRVKSTGINETSDARLKINIDGFDGALEKIKAMRGVTYNWNLDMEVNQGLEADMQYGLIAQELEKVIPELVDTDEEGWKSIEYSHLVPVLIEAIKEQNRIITGQASDISDLKTQATITQKQLQQLMEQVNGVSSNNH